MVNQKKPRRKKILTLRLGKHIFIHSRVSQKKICILAATYSLLKIKESFIIKITTKNPQFSKYMAPKR